MTLKFWVCAESPGALETCLLGSWYQACQFLGVGLASHSWYVSAERESRISHFSKLHWPKILNKQMITLVKHSKYIHDFITHNCFLRDMKFSEDKKASGEFIQKKSCSCSAIKSYHQLCCDKNVKFHFLNSHRKLKKEFCH